MSTLEDIARQNPEWRPWLAALGEVLAELGDRAWDDAVPEHGRRDADAPLLVGVPSLPESALARLARKLAARGCTGAAASELAPMPFLHACRRRWADALPADWSQGYCPVCGAWPSFAELCGVERHRYLRCARCGAAWKTQCLSCAFCGTTDHELLTSLVVERPGPQAAIEACRRCLGYLKTFTRLRPGAPEAVLLEDLASIELDLVAGERGYRRPPVKWAA